MFDYYDEDLVVDEIQFADDHIYVRYENGHPEDVYCQTAIPTRKGCWLRYSGYDVWWQIPLETYEVLTEEPPCLGEGDAVCLVE